MLKVPEAGCYRADSCCEQLVEIKVVGVVYVEPTIADVVDGLVVALEDAVGPSQSRARIEDSVVGFDHCRRELR